MMPGKNGPQNRNILDQRNVNTGQLQGRKGGGSSFLPGDQIQGKDHVSPEASVLMAIPEITAFDFNFKIK